MLKVYIVGISGSISHHFQGNTSRLGTAVFVLLLWKENAMHNVASLLEAFMVELSLQNILGMLLHFTSIYLSSFSRNIYFHIK